MARTVVLIHGAWVDATTWTQWVGRYQARGYHCIAQSWGNDTRTVAQKRDDPYGPASMAGIGELVEQYAAIVRGLTEPPILVGHSFGGLFVEMLLDRGLGAAGVAIAPAPPRGVLPGPTAVRASLPALLGWGSWRTMRRMSLSDFRWGWVHTLSPEQQRAAYETYVIPTSGRVFAQALVAPVSGVTRVNFANPDRAPLLIIAGELDRTVPARMNRTNLKKYQSSTAKTEFREYPGRTHWTCMQVGWEEIADYAIEWAERQIGPRS